MSQNPQEVIQNFLAPSGYASMTDQARRAYILENLNVDRLASSIRSISRKGNQAVQSLNQNEIKDFNFNSSMLGWASNPFKEAPKQIGSEDTSSPDFIDVEGKIGDAVPGFPPAFGNRNVFHPKRFMQGLSGFFNKSNRPRAASAGDNQISIAFLLMVLIILWAGFAVTNTANGTKTTRMKLLGMVITGRGKVA